MRDRRSGLTLRVAGIAALIVAAQAAGVGAMTHRLMADLLFQASLLRGRAVLQALVTPAALAMATHDYLALDNLVTELATAEQDELLVLTVLDDGGTLMASSRSGFLGTRDSLFGRAFVQAAERRSELWFAFGPERRAPSYLDVAFPIEQGQRWGTLLARFSLDSLRRRQEQATWSVATLAAGAGLLFWVIALLLLQRAVVRPTLALSGLAQQLGEGRLDARSPLARRSDELGVLAAALNRMADQLQGSQTRLQEQVAARTRELEAANRELARLASTDSLTELYNVRTFYQTLEHELRRAQRHPQPLTLCMLDLDHFKTFNDSHGHVAGDALLRAFAGLLRQRTRQSDVVARYGGEEFAVLLLACAGEDGLRFADKLVEAVRAHRFEGAEVQPGGRLTVSVGLATFPGDASTAAELVDRADRALYEAKRRGRNQAVRDPGDRGTGSGAPSTDDEEVST